MARCSDEALSFRSARCRCSMRTRRLKALKAGGRETNPAMGAIASNPTALYAVKAGTSAATAYFAERISKKHPKRAVVLMAVLNSAYVAIVAHNYRVANAGR